MDRATYVRALLREREGYVLKGQEGRVADVDAELERQGVEVMPPESVGLAAPESTAAAPPPERATPPRPQRPGR